jgi:hypothetical protein
MVKRTDTTGAWQVYHRSLNYAGGTAEQSRIVLNTTAAQTEATFGDWDRTAPTSTVFYLGGNDDVNASGGTYVAYLFAHDAGGFGLTGTDNVISCGSYSGTGATGNAITLGYEPQWLLIKKTSGAQNWAMFDVMRGFTKTEDSFLVPNLSDAEYNLNDYGEPTATGFTLTSANNNVNQSGQTYIYIAIRRGPMKVPTTGTSVFAPIARAGTNASATVSGVGFPPDLVAENTRNTATSKFWMDRLRGISQYLNTNTTGAESSGIDWVFTMDGEKLPSDILNSSGTDYVLYHLRRAPSFFDEVCYTGTGSARTVSHNLAAVPELMIIKSRNDDVYWAVYSAAIGNDYILQLNSTAAKDGPSAPQWNSTTPTASVFSLGVSSGANASGTTYVAYLFATCAGVSKVGSYTGNGSSQTINCGFTGGARFILIKKTSNTGSWAVWDTARGITSGNDPVLVLNSTAAEYTDGDQVDPDSTGFIVNNVGGFNTDGDTYIFLAIA